MDLFHLAHALFYLKGINCNINNAEGVLCGIQMTCVNVSVVTALVKFIMEILRKLFYLNFNVQGISLHKFLAVIDFLISVKLWS